MISSFFWCHFKEVVIYFYAVIPFIRPSCQHFGNDVNIKVGIHITVHITIYITIHIAIYITTANISIQYNISKFSQVKFSILSFFCTVLFTGCSVKKILKRINQEILHIFVFASMFVSLVKKTALHFLFTVMSYVQGALWRKVWTSYFTEHV